MRRLGELFLGALAVAVAAAVAVRPRPAEQSIGSQSGHGHPRLAGAGAPVATATSPGDIEGLDDTASALKALMTRIKRHNTIMIAASLSYYALLAMFPAAIAAVSIYGLVADPVTLENQITDLTAALPTETATFVSSQLEKIVATSPESLGLATAVSIVLALWSASAGTKALISAINHAYGEPETRSFFVLRGSALAVTIGVIIFGIGSTAVVAFLPRILDAVGLADEAATTINMLRWPFVFVVVVLGLGALFKLAPNRPWRMTRWVNVGAVLATVLWVLATVGMSVYINNWGSSLGETYGTLTGVVVLMLWFFVSGLVVLLGAETNSYLEHHGLYEHTKRG